MKSNATSTTQPLYFVLSFFLAFLFLFSGVFSSSAQAVEVTSTRGIISAESDKEINPVTNIGKGDSTVSYLVNQSNDIAGFDLLKYDSSEGLLSFNSNGYFDMSIEKKQEVMKKILDGVRKSDLTPQRKNVMYNFIADRDGEVTKAIRILSTDAQADLSRAGAIVKVFQTPVGVFLGLLTILVFMFLTLSTAVDIFFITLPPFQAMVSRTDGKRPFYVTGEAFRAVKLSEESVGSSHYKNAMVLYFKERWFAFVIIPMLLLLIVTGQIWELILRFVPNVF